MKWFSFKGAAVVMESLQTNRKVIKIDTTLGFTFLFSGHSRGRDMSTADMSNAFLLGVMTSLPMGPVA